MHWIFRKIVYKMKYMILSIKKLSFRTVFLWWSWRGSNPRPIDCEPIALPTELQPHYAAWFIELRNNCQSFSLVQPYLSVAAIFIWNRSHKSIHMQLTFFNNQTIITVRRYGRHEGTGISAGTNYHNQGKEQKFFHKHNPQNFY